MPSPVGSGRRVKEVRGGSSVTHCHIIAALDSGNRLRAVAGDKG